MTDLQPNLYRLMDRTLKSELDSLKHVQPGVYYTAIMHYPEQDGFIVRVIDHHTDDTIGEGNHECLIEATLRAFIDARKNVKQRIKQPLSRSNKPACADCGRSLFEACSFSERQRPEIPH